MRAGADIFINFLVLEEQINGVGALSPHELLLRATVAKLKHLQLIICNAEAADLSHGSQFKINFKQQKITSISELY